ncbi:na(+) h(+) antiporter [Companilactobacillus nantensis DSM 16982]|uniref:Na(+) h(+) antiporter n=2 Tax=Companilactobacillus nantensis TaxID=305793 RepID=A0A0R1WLE2_9LACO|nr:na(+) h(+) antiporter [Companilactobacillus nantensis DSM 16982]
MLLLLAVIPAQLLFDRFKRIPLAVYQISLGFGLSFLPLFSNLNIDPEVFLLVIISTLMFSDSRKLNLGRFAYSLRSTLSLAVNLVFMSILVVGTFAHVIVPELTWFGGFMIAAILSPTDAVAYQSITAGLSLPNEVDTTLKNESLLNDATGLVAFNLTVSALITGHFSFFGGLTSFGYVFLGGIILGLLLGWGFMTIRRWMIMHHSDTNIVIVPFILVTPYIVYFIAEELNMSGILAVVAAGLLRTWEQRNWQLSTARIQNSTYTVENMISSVLNGVVFIILGINLLTIYQLSTTLQINVIIIGIISISLYLVLAMVRFTWFYMKSKNDNDWQKRCQKSLLSSINGVHGTVTLMMALSIPQDLPGVSVSLRSAIVLITIFVILLSMIVPIIFTSKIVRNTSISTKPNNRDIEIWNGLVDNTLQNLKSQKLPTVIFDFLYPIIVTQRPMTKLKQRDLMNLFQDTQNIEQQVVNTLINQKLVSTNIAKYHQNIIAREVLNQQLTPWTSLMYWFQVINHRQSVSNIKSEQSILYKQRQLIESVSYELIMDFLKQQDTNLQSVTANTLARIYSTRHDETLNLETINQERFYMLQMFANEIEQVRQLYWQNEITLSESRKFIYDLSLQQTIFVGRHFE